MSPLEALVRAVPKVDLHLHLVGSASPDVVAELAARHPDAGVPTRPDQLARWYRFRDFAHFIEIYAQVSSLVRSGDDIATLVRHAARDLAAQNGRYAEITVTPVTHVAAGIPYPEVVAGLDHGRAEARRLGVELAWVFDVPGELGQPAARATLGWAVDHPPDGLVAFGLGGVEAGVDRARFAWAFDAARAVGLRSVPHAGEADGPRSIVAALDRLGADRIGHGIRAVDDAALLARLAADQVPLEVCPSSNVCTGVVPALDDHPLPRLLDAGVFVTINTDDPPMFATTLCDEYLRVAHQFQLDHHDVERLAINGVTASFLPDSTKTRLIDEIRASTAECLP